MSDELEVLSRPAAVTFGMKNITPPSNVYVDPADELVVISYGSASSVRVDIRGEHLLADQNLSQLEFAHVPNSDRTAKTTSTALGEGFLLNLSAFLGSGTAKRGQVYVQVALARGQGSARFIHTILMQGYVGNGVNLAWPGGALEQPASGPGYIRTVAGTNPAAGAEILETVPTGARWKLLATRIELVSSGTAGNRSVALALLHTALAVTIIQAPIVQPASKDWVYDCSIGIQVYTPSDANSVVMPLPAEVTLVGGDTIGTSTGTFKVDDDYAAPKYTIEEWIYP